MKTPKISFKPMTLDENIELIKWAFFKDDDVLSVYSYTVEYFSDLKNIDRNLPKDVIYKEIESVVIREYNKNKSKIDKEVIRYGLLWDKYNDIYFSTLSEYLGIDWPLDLENIVAKVGIIPIFPRYLDSFSFSISIDVNDILLIETCAHETLHFLWFEKWKKIHPEIPRKEYDSPYMVWRYSEMVTDPILNNKPFSDLFDFYERGYDSFYELYDGDVLIMDNLRELFSQDVHIDKKINDGYDYVRKLL